MPTGSAVKRFSSKYLGPEIQGTLIGSKPRTTLIFALRMRFTASLTNTPSLSATQRWTLAESARCQGGPGSCLVIHVSKDDGGEGEKEKYTQT